ncbi:MAG: hypothetical protein JRG73_03145 [Deltaproteobacteria bacterium]|nr:hypothetical protein [Deltaproteobacteria bacterium]MBW2305907.1 hypothetical protein [Deltaproteobacteria bacterium]
MDENIGADMQPLSPLCLRQEESPCATGKIDALAWEVVPCVEGTSKMGRRE